MDKKPYVFHYDDGTYFVFDLTEHDTKKLFTYHSSGHSHVELSFGSFKLTDIKVIVEWKEPEPSEDDPKEGDPDTDSATREWLRQQRELERSDDD